MSGKLRGRPFQKGISGNPGGRKKLPVDIRESAKLLTPRALEIQAEIMEDGDAPPAARIAAAENIINRAYGKPEGTTNLNIGAGAAFVEMLRFVNERRREAGNGAVANGVDHEAERPAGVRH